MKPEDGPKRHIGLLGATGVGVGAIVGGGILALAGTAFATTGPSAIVAFALNGLIALLTAVSFAEIASKFPQSGGTYTFAKKVLSVETAFTIGWTVWFASIVAAALYALGFGQFAIVAIADIWRGLTGSPLPLSSARPAVCTLAVAATLFYAIGLARTSSGGRQYANIGKILVFIALIVCGLWALRDRTAVDITESLSPFFAHGSIGLFQAMGFTFIAMQGFDLIAAVAGEIRQPAKTIPRAMLGSLAIALVIYLPLLLIIVTVGMPTGLSVTDASRQNAETIVAIAAQNYLGRFGYWLVMLAAIFSMLSALHANLFAASRVVMAMSGDRTLPRALSRISPHRRTPVTAVFITAAIIIVIVLALPNVATAGAASSLIFLVTFALAHWIAILVRQRSGAHPPPFRAPLFPLVPVIGGLACLSLAIYQGLTVPSAGMITSAWLCLGGLLFLGLFARHARIADASRAALDPEVAQLRGRSPLVLVPIANPDNAPALVAMANALAPPEIGRVLLLSVVVAPRLWRPTEDVQPLRNAQSVLGQAISASVKEGLYPESLTTIAPDPWPEIARVASVYHCESLLLGLSDLSQEAASTPLDALMSQMDCDIVVLRAATTWHLDDARRILVPTRGRGDHDRLLARLLSSLSRSTRRQITFLRILPEQASDQALRGAERTLKRMAYDLCSGNPGICVVRSDQPVQEVAARANEADLLILGVERINRHRKWFGQFALKVARQTPCAMVLISRG